MCHVNVKGDVEGEKNNNCNNKAKKIGAGWTKQNRRAKQKLKQRDVEYACVWKITAIFVFCQPIPSIWHTASPIFPIFSPPPLGVTQNVHLALLSTAHDGNVFIKYWSRCFLSGRIHSNPSRRKKNRSATVIRQSETLLTCNRASRRCCQLPAGNVTNRINVRIRYVRAHVQ